MFASRSLAEHVLRGGAGFALIALAFWLAPLSLWVLLLVPLGLLLLRGCPMCWTVGLIQTLTSRRSANSGNTVGMQCDACHIDKR
jgi:hypothetical protein